MTKKRTTKQALVASFLALVMCVSMYVGSTFAWFTDNVSSSSNRIVAGKLKVDLLMDKELNEIYDSIANGSGDIFDEYTDANKTEKNFWEPGKTQIVFLKVANNGDLDFKYNIVLNVTDNGLVGALEYAVIDGVKAGDLDGVTTWTDLKTRAQAQTGDIKSGVMFVDTNGAIKAGDEGDYFAFAVHMKENAGNEYQEKDAVIDVLVQATQLSSESDSFGVEYDKFATYSSGFYWINSFGGNATVAGNNTFEYSNVDGTFKASGTSDGTSDVKVTFKAANTESHLVVQGRSVLSYDIDVTGRAKDSEVKIEMFIGKNLAGVNLYHEGALMNSSTYSYNSLTGFITFTATDFSVYSVSVVTAGILPLAAVKELKGEELTIDVYGFDQKATLTSGYQFEPTETYEQSQLSKYKNWHADFVVSANKDVHGNTLALAGYYAAYCDIKADGKWIGIATDETIPANTEIRLITPDPNTDPIMEGTSSPLAVPYELICYYGNDGTGFRCGLISLDDEALKGTTVTVELRLYRTYTEEECMEKFGDEYDLEYIEVGPEEYVVIGRYEYTFR